MKAHRLGYWSSAAVATIGVAYIVALAAGFARHGFREPITDPVLAIMEILTLLSAPALLLVMAAIHDVAPPDRKIYGLIAVAFATLFTGITCAVHFLELSAGRQLGNASIVWPSRSYAAELLAWDVFLGFALLAAAASLHMTDIDRTLSRLASVCGGLCVIGIVHLAHEAYTRAINSNNLDSLTEMFTEDVVFLAAHSAPIVGKPAVREWAKGYFDAFTTHWDKTTQEFKVAGEWAFERYSYKSTDTPKAGGTPIADSGWGLVIYHHDTDGKWRVARDAFSTEAALPTK